MKIENAFRIAVPVDEACALVTDVPRIAPCLPGAEVTEDLGDGRYRGEAAVRLGPVGLRFVGEAWFVEQDAAKRVAVLQAGRVVEQGPAEALFARPQTAYAAALMAAAFPMEAAPG